MASALGDAFKATIKNADTATDATRALSSLADAFKGMEKGQFRSIIKTFTQSPEMLSTLASVFKKMPVDKGLTDALKNIDGSDLKKIVGKMESGDRAAFISKVDGFDPDLAKRMDPSSGTAASRALEQAADAARANSKKLIAGGIVLGGGIYLNKKYKDAEEDIKNCIGVCLPDNWDEHAYGSLEKSELKYRPLTYTDGNGEEITVDENQPLCSNVMDDCEKYCSDQCEELHDYDAPGIDLAKGAGDDAGDLFEDLFKSFTDLFSGLFSGSGMLSMVSLGLCALMFVFLVMTMMT
jgi:hypothetical protein|tara:strand:+ start:1476 stop:2360 length:885 start_codon:yes stop_codon:yes gene_type:complete